MARDLRSRFGSLRAEQMSRNADLDLINLTKKYGDTVAVDDISLKIPSGTYCCLLGPSGCGSGIARAGG